MKNSRAKGRFDTDSYKIRAIGYFIIIILFLLPSAIFAHDPHGWGVAICWAGVLAIALATGLILLAIKLIRKFIRKSITRAIVITISIIFVMAIAIFSIRYIWVVVYFVYDRIYN